MTLQFYQCRLRTFYNGKDKEKISIEVAREINEELSALCKKYPQKFGFVAVLPMPSVKGSIEEINFATEKLGALGVKVASNSDGIYLGDEILNPIFEELNRKKSLVILHPSPARSLPRENVVTGKVMALYEYPADTTRAILNLLANGTLEKFSVAGDPMPEEMDILLKIATAEKFLYGSDYPYVPAEILLKKKNLLDAELVERNLTQTIYSNNAKKILE